ncbi:hypothetical protein PR048_013433 [Dryococelus australis]|uniref:Uncharacterized protein n=1 Tax=Dryococelus australis TaxID=614101 RepID=A0ABQ9HS63_9NEOP|nr:hypothetical protein PR048_013433 [Dryococelus australis]
MILGLSFLTETKAIINFQSHILTFGMATCSNIDSIRNKLNVDQHKKLKETLAEFSDVITKRLGCCKTMPYHIKVSDEEPI